MNKVNKKIVIFKVFTNKIEFINKKENKYRQMFNDVINFKNLTI